MTILDIENEIRNNNLTEKEILLLYKEYLIKIFRSRENMSFKEDYFYHITTKDTNCYAYALGIEIPLFLENKINFNFRPGFISDREEHNNKIELLENVYADLDTLHLHYQKAGIDDYDQNKYKMAIFSEIPYYFGEYKKDFHFIRQNDDLKWSDKLGYSLNVRKSIEMPNVQGYDLVKILKINKKSK